MAGSAQTRMQQRRGTSTEWASLDPVLLAGELGIDTTQGIVKVGDGVKRWSELPEMGGGATFVLDEDDTIVCVQDIKRTSSTTVTSMATNIFWVPGAKMNDRVEVHGATPLVPINASYGTWGGCVIAPDLVQTSCSNNYQQNTGSTTRIILQIIVHKNKASPEDMVERLQTVDASGLAAILADERQKQEMLLTLACNYTMRQVVQNVRTMRLMLENEETRRILLTKQTPLMYIVQDEFCTSWLMGHNDIFQSHRTEMWEALKKMDTTVLTTYAPWYWQKTNSSTRLSSFTSTMARNASYLRSLVFLCFGVQKAETAETERVCVLHPDGSVAAEGNGGGRLKPTTMESVDCVTFDGASVIGAGEMGDVNYNGYVYVEMERLQPNYAY
ncbi:MAG: hypothetical protein IJR14_01915 [Synergistaceae bacterium]|nr:hypothetical protein [Synergistaceae bacterium]